ncbi:MAG: hypothetical protein JNM66_32495 [Bryobacterales bacterium]|nr:hypothetical protein [Bryobacterales bacterium]
MAFLICAGLTVAQQSTPLPKEEKTALSGCLSKGAAAGEYILTTENGQKTMVMSTDDLSKHVAHTVRVTGESTTLQGKTVFRADLVEHIADSCK